MLRFPGDENATGNAQPLRVVTPKQESHKVLGTRISVQGAGRRRQQPPPPPGPPPSHLLRQRSRPPAQQQLLAVPESPPSPNPSARRHHRKTSSMHGVSEYSELARATSSVAESLSSFIETIRHEAKTRRPQLGTIAELGEQSFLESHANGLLSAVNQMLDHLVADWDNVQQQYAKFRDRAPLAMRAFGQIPTPGHRSSNSLILFSSTPPCSAPSSPAAGGASSSAPSHSNSYLVNITPQSSPCGSPATTPQRQTTAKPAGHHHQRSIVLFPSDLSELTRADSDDEDVARALSLKCTPPRRRSGSERARQRWKRAVNTIIKINRAVASLDKGEDTDNTAAPAAQQRFVEYVVGLSRPVCSQPGSPRHADLTVSAFPSQPHDDFPVPPGLQEFALPAELEDELEASLSLVVDGEVPIKTDAVYFSFVLTDANADRIYVSCARYFERSAGDDTFEGRALCLVSKFPFFSVFQHCLEELYSMSGTSSYQSPEELLALIAQEVLLPVPGGPVVAFECGMQTVELHLPSQHEFPLLDCDLRHSLFSHFSVDRVIALVGAALSEHKILLCSDNVTRLAQVGESLLALLFPFRWYHVYIPLLPKSMMHVIDAPVPFILGVEKRHLDGMDASLDNVIVVDIDKGSVGRPSPSARMSHLPPKEASLLKRELREQVQHKRARDSKRFNSGVRRAFLKAYSSVLQGYRKFLFFLGDGVPIFNADAFLRVRMRSTPDKLNFLSTFLSSQLFAWFLEDAASSTLFHELVHEGPAPSSTASADVQRFFANKAPSSRREIFSVPPRSSDPSMRFCDWTSVLRQDASLFLKPRQFGNAYFVQTQLRQAEFFRDNSSADIRRMRRQSSATNMLGGRRRSTAPEEESRVQAMLARIFLSERVDPHQLDYCMSQLESSSGARRYFSHTLLQPQEQDQGKLELSSDAFGTLTRLVKAVLDAAGAAHEYDVAKECLDAGGVFFTVVDNKKTLSPLHVFLEQRIRRHKICRDKRLWEHIYASELDSARLQSPGDDLQGVLVRRMGSLINLMLTYGRQPRHVKRFVVRMSKELALTDEQVETLEILTTNISMALQMNDQIASNAATWT